MASAATLDLEIEQGGYTSYYLTVNSVGVPADLTGAVFEGEIRYRPEAPVAANIEFANDNPTSGIVQFSVTAAEAAKLDRERQYRYDIFATLTGTPRTKLLKGRINVSEQITS